VNVDAGDRHRVGRRRHRGSNAPPVWFGIPFAGAGLLVLVLGLTTRGAPVAFIVPFGLLFFVVGVALVWTSLRARNAETPKSRINVGPLDVERFTRSPMQVFVDLIAAPLGGIGFLVAAVISLPTIIGPIMFGFFGILMLRGAAVTIRRGIGTTIATVGPDGIWTPELGQLAWPEIAELRVEDFRGIGGSNNNAVVGYARLGIVPRSAELAERAPGRGAIGMARGFMSLVNTVRPGTDLSDPSKLAPYGITASELEQPFADVVRSVQRFAPVAGAEAALGDGTRVVEDAGPAAAVAEPAVVPPAPSLSEGLAAISPALAGASVLSGTPFVPSGSASASPAAPAEARTFLRSGGPIGTFGMIGDLAGALPWVAFPVVFVTLFVGVTLLDADSTFNPVMLIAFAFLLVPVGFFAYGISLLLALPARWRIRRGDPQVLTVDSDGIDLRGMGRLRWAEIEDVRVVNSDRPTGEGSPNIPRLEIVPRDRSRLVSRSVWDRRRDAWRSFLRRLKPFGDRSPVEPRYGIDFDLLDANPNDVIDLIARYRVVEDEF
jgi:hypothetical protein